MPCGRSGDKFPPSVRPIKGPAGVKGQSYPRRRRGLHSPAMNADSVKLVEKCRRRPRRAKAFKFSKAGRDAETTCSGPAAREYQRARDLPRLLGMWPHDIHDTSDIGVFRVIARLRKALRAERRLGLAGRWSYDLERHLALARALKAEIEALDKRARTGRRVSAPCRKKKILKKTRIPRRDPCKSSDVPDRAP